MKFVRLLMIAAFAVLFVGCQRDEPEVTEEYIPHEERGVERVEGHDRGFVEEDSIEVEVVKPPGA